MEYIIINAIIYGVTLIIYWRYNRRIDLGFLILAVFTIVAILAIPNHFFLDTLYKRSISLIPFIYLYVTFLLFIRPYLGVNLPNSIGLRSLRKLTGIMYLYIFSSLISVYAVLPYAIKNIDSGEWNQVRNDLYSDEFAAYYSNSFEHLMLVISQYINSLAILTFFYFLSLQKFSKKFMFLLGLSCILPVLLVSVVTSSRGTLVGLLMQCLAGYIIFKTQIPIRIKKVIYISFIATIVVFLIFSIAVTNSRFGEDSGYDYSSSFSLLDYFGQPMLVFNHGIASMHDYANGKYFFGYILDAFQMDTNINEKLLGGNYGQGFMTFIGTFYIDFGPLGTVLLSLILSYFISKNIKGKIIYFENIFLYFFFYNFFLQGVFVTAPSSIINWLLAFLLYFYLKFSRNYA